MGTKSYVTLTDILCSEKKISVITSEWNCEISFADGISKLLDIEAQSSVSELEITLSQHKFVVIQYPENSCHPLIAVKNAEMVVDLAKKVDCKIIIITHSPDFVSAIKYYSEKVGLRNSDISFFFCEYDDKESITFLNCGTDIEPIFKSFNLSLDRVSAYR